MSNDNTELEQTSAPDPQGRNEALVVPEKPLQGELIHRPRGYFTKGDYVTRDGTDIHYVEEHDDDLLTVVCIIAPQDKWAKPGELENNLTRRYSKIDNKELPRAKMAHEILKKLHPDGWWY